MAIRDLMPWHWGEKRVPIEHEADVLASLQTEMNTLLDNFRSRFAAELPHSDSPLFNAMPSIDVRDSKGQTLVTVELPGMDEKDIELSLSRNSLTIRGEKIDESKHDEGGWVTNERRYGRFERFVPLPANVDASAARARIRKGVLTVELPHTDAPDDECIRVPISDT